jgi:peroxiredoxin Q/BCP
VRRTGRWAAAITGAAVLLAAGFVVSERAGLLAIGDTAPAIDAPGQDGTPFLLGALRGRSAVVLSFYPKDFSAGCTKQLCSYRDSHEEIAALGGVLVGISPDPASSHRGFAAQHRLPFPLLSDPDRSIARRYGVLRWGGLLPVNKRVTYVVDRRGIIRAVIHKELNVEGHLEGILEALRKLQEEEGREATPSAPPG